MSIIINRYTFGLMEWLVHFIEFFELNTLLRFIKDKGFVNDCICFLFRCDRTRLRSTLYYFYLYIITFSVCFTKLVVFFKRVVFPAVFDMIEECCYWSWFSFSDYLNISSWYYFMNISANFCC